MRVPAVPTPSDTGVEHVDAAARALVAEPRPLVLAVSGGRDSMVLLHSVHAALAASGAQQGRPMLVATFDHGTGAAATAAASLVAARATDLGFPISASRASRPGSSESDWRRDRWAFFRAVTPPDGMVVTAHTWDDHIETVVMRTLRGAGARGLAGLAASSARVVRPFLGISRAILARYAEVHGVPFVDDPSNASRRHLRNRVRLDLLPAVRALRPRFEAEVSELADRAAALRAAIDRFAERHVTWEGEAGPFFVARDELATYDSAVLCVLWPAIAARAGVTLDRRGTLRLAQFTTSGAPGARIQLSGGVEVLRRRSASGDAFVFRRVSPGVAASGPLPLEGIVQFGNWRFRPTSPLGAEAAANDSLKTSDGSAPVEDDAWSADLPADTRLTVRTWRAGDRMRPGPAQAARRVKRFFGDARISGSSRTGWPVVLADDEIVWIPGVRRLRAAPERSGRPMVRYACERFDGGLAYS